MSDSDISLAGLPPDIIRIIIPLVEEPFETQMKLASHPFFIEQDQFTDHFRSLDHGIQWPRNTSARDIVPLIVFVSG